MNDRGESINLPLILGGQETGSLERWHLPPHEVLTRILAQGESGRLVVINPWDEFVHWQVYVGNGKIHFANSRKGHYSRLQYLIGRYLDNTPLKLPPQLEDDYPYLYYLWENKTFNSEQTHFVLKQCTQEALVQVLAIAKAHCFFEPRIHLKNIFLNLDPEVLLPPLETKIKYWQQVQRYIHSPFQRPLAKDQEVFNHYLKNNLQKDPYWITCFNASLENLFCLYEIAYRTEISTLELALLLKPLIKTGQLQMLGYDAYVTEPDERLLVAVINRKPTLQRVLRFILESQGFRVLVIEDTCKALAILLAKHPTLILIEEEMLDLGGCPLTELFRQSRALEDVPIIALTKEDSLIEKIKLKLMGISSIIIYPFLPQDLIKIIKGQLSEEIKKSLRARR